MFGDIRLRYGRQRYVVTSDHETSMAVLLETTLGDIVVDLYTEERPKSNNFSFTLNHCYDEYMRGST